MTATAIQWQEEWQRGDGKGVTPCRQVLLIADLAEVMGVLEDAETTLRECVALVPMIDGRGIVAVLPPSEATEVADVIRKNLPRAIWVG